MVQFLSHNSDESKIFKNYLRNMISRRIENVYTQCLVQGPVYRYTLILVPDLQIYRDLCIINCMYYRRVNVTGGLTFPARNRHLLARIDNLLYRSHTSRKA